MMKRLLMLVMLSVPSWGAAPAVLHLAKNFCSAATTCACTVTSTTAGNLMLVYVGGNGTSTTLNAPTDNGSGGSDSYVGQTGTHAVDAATGQSEAFVALNIKGAVTTVTETTSAAHAILMQCFEISGAPTTSAVDQQGLINDTCTACTVSTAGATTNATELAIAYFFNHNANGAWSAPNWTQQQTNADAGDGDSDVSEALTTASTGTQTATYTGGNTASQGSVITFFPVAAGGAVAGYDKRKKLCELDEEVC